jgi:hypothetical protein
MKLIALKPLLRPSDDGKPVNVSQGGTFDADAGEAKNLIRAGLAKAADDAKPAAPAAAAAPAVPKA